MGDQRPPEPADPVEIVQTPLPGIGLRHDFATRAGRRVGVISHRSGRRDLVVYDLDDPDACREQVALGADEADALAELLGAPRVVERLAAIREQAAGLVTERLPIPAGSPYAGRTLGDTRARTRTGASIVAVLRRGEVVVAPGPDFRFEPDDQVVAVGGAAGVEGVARILAGG